MRRFVPDEVNGRVAPNPFAAGEPCSLHLEDVNAIGSSAMVFRADVLGRRCLVKVLRPSAVCEQRARDEYQLLAELDGAASHAPRVFAYGGFYEDNAIAPAGAASTDGAAAEPAPLPAIAMEYVGGLDLYGLRRAMADGEGRVGSAAVLAAARQLTLALMCCSVESHADERYLTLVSHRDVSANNVRFVLGKTGEVERVVLIDFGQGVEADTPDVTPSGALERSSTPFVGAPEMFDQRPKGSRMLRNSSYADTYSVGCLLYYLRVGDWALCDEIRRICRRYGQGTEGRQALCDLKMRAPIHLPASLVTSEDDRKLDELIARCTAPGAGAGKLKGRYDLVRLGLELGISEDQAIAVRQREPRVEEPQAAEAPSQDPAATVQATPLDALPTSEVAGGATLPADARAYDGETSSPNSAASARNLVRKARGKSSVPLALKVLTCVAVVAALAVAFTVHVLPRLAPSQTAVAADSNTYALYPATSLSAAQLGQTASLMQARLASVEGSSAEMLGSADGVLVTLPASLWSASDLEGSLKDGATATAADARTWAWADAMDLLENPLALYFVDASDEAAILNGSASRVRVYRTEIASAQACQGNHEGLEQAGYLTDDARAYVRLTLTDEGTSRLKEEAGSWYGQGVFAFDLEGSSYYTTSTVAADDGSFAISASCMPMLAHAQMVAAALTSDEYPAQFSGQAVPGITWEEPDSANEGQTAADAIEGDDAWVVVADSTDFTDGERLDARTSLAARCEAMGVPWALGSTAEGGVAIKLQAESFDALAAKVLVQGSAVTLSYGTGQRTLASGQVGLSEEDGNVGLVVSGGQEDDSTAVSQVVEGAYDAPGTWVYAEMLDIPLMCGTVDAAEDSSISLDIACLDGAKAGENHAWLPRLIVSACETSASRATVTYVGKPDLSWPGSPGLTGSLTNSARSAIKRANPAATVGCDADYPAHLLVYLPSEGLSGTGDASSLAASALAEVQAAYEEMGFESGPFTQLAYSFGGTSSNPAGTIVFKKHRAMTESEASSVEVQFAATDELSDTLSAQAATSEFYADKLAS